MAHAKEAWVIALGLNGLPVVYVIHRSRSHANEARNLGSKELTQLAPGHKITHGKAVLMSHADLSTEIPGFKELITCLDANGIVVAIRPEAAYFLGAQKTDAPRWQFNCQMVPTKQYPGRLPPPGGGGRRKSLPPPAAPPVTRPECMLSVSYDLGGLDASGMYYLDTFLIGLVGEQPTEALISRNRTRDIDWVLDNCAQANLAAESIRRFAVEMFEGHTIVAVVRPMAATA